MRKELEFTVNLKSGPHHCIVAWNGIHPGETHTEFGHTWQVYPPGLEGLELVSVAPSDAEAPAPVSSDDAKIILEYAENLILAGEGL